MPDTALPQLPLPRPFDARMLAVGDGHWIYVEEVGTRGGIPALFLHGGPGSGAQHVHRRLFDPERHHAFLIDQRGAGRSHPHLSLTANTTAHLVEDIEIVRRHFEIERWLVVGGSWGSTLALAFAERYPERVSGLVLRAIFLGTRDEVQWAFVDGPRRFRPDLFADFAGALPEAERGDVLGAYVRRLLGGDAVARREAALRWHAYERALSELAPGGVRLPASLCSAAALPPTPVVEAHYIRHDFFLASGQLLAGAERLAGIPGVIVQGRYDLLCPPRAAFDLAAAWPGVELTFLEAAGHAMSEAGVTERLQQAVLHLSR